MREQAKGIISLESWMCTELNLKGNELIIYGVIYSYTHDGEHWFYGTRQMLADWAGCSKNTVTSALSSLVGKGLARKRTRTENGVTFNDYQITRG